ncbi:hypothetical protein J3R30DRAFT_3693577 [Lentinula aciculospora]|uniref:G domain-containing protein n=1 Tax=Lentinula aciculospora TaxID=153920 RepID=A0A9W9DWT7_9AGAR|nr:hypothetical protein J3R30DRAFT_3693577 [Lentinula aciculospora]
MVVPDPSPPTTAASTPPRSNILLVGPNGSGKSSIINIFADREIATTTVASFPFPFNVQKHEILLGPRSYCFDEISALSYGKPRDHKSDYVEKLSEFIRSLQDGVSPLVFCLRAPRITETAEKIYDLFYDDLCGRKIPIVTVLTGLEDEEPSMVSWWVRNKTSFMKYGMSFQGHACVTTTKGRKTSKGYIYQEEYDLSKKAIEKLVTDHSLEPGICVEFDDWFHIPSPTCSFLFGEMTKPVSSPSIPPEPVNFEERQPHADQHGPGGDWIQAASPLDLSPATSEITANVDTFAKITEPDPVAPNGSYNVSSQAVALLGSSISSALDSEEIE